MVDTRVNILCVDDSTDMTELLSRVIQGQDDLRCAGCLADTEELLAEVDRTGADIVLMDLRIPGRDPLAAVAELSRVRPGCRVVVYSGYDDESSIRSASDAGAWGYVSKALDIERALDVVRSVAGGRRCFPDSTRG